MCVGRNRRSAQASFHSAHPTHVRLGLSSDLLFYFIAWHFVLTWVSSTWMLFYSRSLVSPAHSGARFIPTCGFMRPPNNSMTLQTRLFIVRVGVEVPPHLSPDHYVLLFVPCTHLCISSPVVGRTERESHGYHRPFLPLLFLPTPQRGTEPTSRNASGKLENSFDPSQFYPHLCFDTRRTCYRNSGSSSPCLPQH